jgi:3-oxoadipate enol-lactonase
LQNHIGALALANQRLFGEAWAMPKIRVRDVELYYEIHGKGPRLFYIGGSGGDLRDKPGVFDGPLAEEFEILSYDQRGLGQSDVPEGPYTMADYGEDAAALLRELDFGPCPVMGVSFGGMVAQELIPRAPDQITRLVLACTSAGGGAGSSYPLHELQDLPPRERALRSTKLSDVRYDAAWREAHPDRAERLIDLAMERGRPRDEATAHGQRRQLEARSHHDTTSHLADITVPTYLCAGRYDGIAPPENQRALLAALPNATLDFFEGGHLFLIQDRAAFGRIAEFLRG